MDILEPIGPRKAVVLVAHGLNLRAFALRSLFEPLRARGATIVVLRFRGHARDSAADDATREEWQSVDVAQWVDDWRAGVHAAAALAEGVPLIFLGYSLGALVHVYALSTGQLALNPFTRQVLIAPPVRIRPRTRLTRLLRPLGRRFMVYSFAPKAIRSHAATSIAAYEAVFAMEAALATPKEPLSLATPTLVIIDPLDELVSYRRLVQWIDQHHLRGPWVIRPLLKDRRRAQSMIHHYMIDEESLGDRGLEALVAILANEVFGSSSLSAIP